MDNLKELRETKKEFDKVLADVQKSSQQISDLLTGETQYDRDSVADFDTSPDGNYNIA